MWLIMTMLNNKNIRKIPNLDFFSEFSDIPDCFRVKLACEH